MNSKGKRSTGEIIPRTYGLILSMPDRDNLFVSPMSYALAQIKLERPSEIRARLNDWARRRSLPAGETERIFKEAVGQNKEVLLNHMRSPFNPAKPAIKDVRHRGEVFTGRVVSGTYDASKGEVEYHNVSLRHPSASRDVNVGFSRGECDCGDARYNGYKKKAVTAVCSHMAALEVALSTDVQNRVSKAESITDLLPRDRTMASGRSALPHPQLPFRFNVFDRRMNDQDRRRYDILTDMVMDYFMGEKGFYEINGEALSHPEILSPELLKALNGPRDRARFAVLRHDEKSVSPKSESQDRIYGAITHALEQIKSHMAERGFFPAGYTREFLGTPWEMVATRYIQPRSEGASLVYSVGTSEDIPPVIVRRHLGHKSGNLFDLTSEVDHLHPFARIGIPYESRDDSTRRMGQTQVFTPLLKERSSLKIADNLVQRYNGLMVRYRSDQSSSLFKSTI